VKGVCAKPKVVSPIKRAFKNNFFIILNLKFKKMIEKTWGKD
jgi:hypothetical protein